MMRCTLNAPEFEEDGSECGLVLFPTALERYKNAEISFIMKKIQLSNCHQYLSVAVAVSYVMFLVQENTLF